MRGLWKSPLCSWGEWQWFQRQLPLGILRSKGCWEAASRGLVSWGRILPRERQKDRCVQSVIASWLLKRKGSSFCWICLWSSAPWTYIWFLQRQGAAGKNKMSCFLLKLQTTSAFKVVWLTLYKRMWTNTELLLIVPVRRKGAACLKLTWKCLRTIRWADGRVDEERGRKWWGQVVPSGLACELPGDPPRTHLGTVQVSWIRH